MLLCSMRAIYMHYAHNTCGEHNTLCTLCLENVSHMERANLAHMCMQVSMALALQILSADFCIMICHYIC